MLGRVIGFGEIIANKSKGNDRCFAPYSVNPAGKRERKGIRQIGERVSKRKVTRTMRDISVKIKEMSCG